MSSAQNTVRLPRWVEVVFYLASWPSWNFRRKWWRLQVGYHRAFRFGGAKAARRYANEAGTAYIIIALRRLASPWDWFDPGALF